MVENGTFEMVLAQFEKADLVNTFDPAIFEFSCQNILLDFRRWNSNML